jgi:SDR family mycofactocin-dependent oxidoreductase
VTDAPGVALVTGAARGIGAATVAALAADGWRVVAVDRCADDPALPYPLGSRAELDRVVAAAPDPAAVTAVEADVRDPETLAAAVRLAEERWGGLDAAIAAAGVIAGGVPAWQVPPGQERAVLDVDLGGVLNLARAAVPALLRRPEPRRGRFIAVASAAATRGLPMLAAYCAAKAGVTGFVRALAAELGGTGITANAVSPGSTQTPMLDESARLYGLPTAGAFAAQQPLGRLVSPAEVAAVIAFLAGDGGSAMTGAVVPVDGGLALLLPEGSTSQGLYSSRAASSVMSTPVSALLTGQPSLAACAAWANCSAFRPSTSPRTVSLMPVSLKPPAGSGPSDTSACTSSACGVPPAWATSADSCMA